MAHHSDLSFSGFSGSIPNAIGNATGLQHLSIGKNQYFVDPEFPEDPPSMLSVMATMSAPVLQGPMAHLSCLAPLTRLRHLYGPLSLPPPSHPCPPSPLSHISSLPAFSPLSHLIPARLLPSLTSHPCPPSHLSHISSLPAFSSPLSHPCPPSPPLSLMPLCLSHPLPLSALTTLNLTAGELPSSLSALTALTTL
ncbi:unnamed protein product [Closterium sp. NIES-64]|nr:unnamed protein product [Closterium sp. NIES-64]